MNAGGSRWQNGAERAGYLLGDLPLPLAANRLLKRPDTSRRHIFNLCGDGCGGTASDAERLVEGVGEEEE